MQLNTLLAVLLSAMGTGETADTEIHADPCRLTHAAGDWSLEIHQGSDEYGAQLSSTVLDFRHQPSGLILWVSGRQQGFVSHHLLYGRHVIETMRAVRSDFVRDHLGGVRTYHGVAEIYFDDPGTNWSWRAEGSFHHMQSSPSSAYYYTISPGLESVDYAELIDRFGSGALGDVTVSVNFAPTGGETISLRTATIDPDGMAELSRQSDDLQAQFETACLVAD